MADILVVDDEKLICEMLDILLSRAGHRVTTAFDGIQALEAVKTTPVDLVIADIVMPEKDGLETIMQLRQEHPSIQIIAISGGSRIGNADFLAMAAEFGACETFYKPLDKDALLCAVDKCLSGSSE